MHCYEKNLRRWHRCKLWLKILSLWLFLSAFFIQEQDRPYNILHMILGAMIFASNCYVSISMKKVTEMFGMWTTYLTYVTHFLPFSHELEWSHQKWFYNKWKAYTRASVDLTRSIDLQIKIHGLKTQGHFLMFTDNEITSKWKTYIRTRFDFGQIMKNSNINTTSKSQFLHQD